MRKMTLKPFRIAALLLGPLAIAGCAISPAGQYWAPEESRQAELTRRPHYLPLATTKPAKHPTTQPARSAELHGKLDEAYRKIYQNQFKEAAAQLADLAAEITPADDCGAEVLFWLGFCRQELGDRDAARRAYQRVIASWPEDRYSERARQLLAELK